MYIFIIDRLLFRQLFFYWLICSLKIKKVKLMNKRDIAGYLGINRTTLYNWEKERPNLYKTLMLGLLVDEIIEKSEKNIEELKELKNSLSEKPKKRPFENK